jgi:Metallo-peptidase family M12B Reprolysin-like
MCEYSGIVGRSCIVNKKNRAPMLARLKVAEAETNNAMNFVNVQIRIIRVVFTSDPTWDPIANQASLDALNYDKRLKRLRRRLGADLVSVIGGQSDTCGIAFRYNFKSIVSQDCFSQYSFSHEIGHNFGGNHDRGDFIMPNHPWAYAYQYQNEYRTFLSYNCFTENGCPRLPYYSSSQLTLSDGRPLGDEKNDNLRQIAKFAPTVAGWRTRPTMKPT